MNGVLGALEDFNTYMEQQLNVWKVPGAAVAIIKDQEIILANGYGYRDKESGLKVTPNTLFAIASCTKAFTAMAAEQLADEGMLDLDAPIKNYMPHFRMYDSFATERITIRDMLCHRSGLPRHDAIWYNSELTREEIIERLEYLEPNQDFRAKGQYQNIMYMVAGYLVGKLAGYSWEQRVQERIFAPLHMKSSCFSVDEMQLRDDYALAYIDKNGETQQIPFRNMDSIGPAGSINSNIIDMANWIMLHLNRGMLDGKQIVSEGRLDDMHTPHIPCEPSLWGKKELPLSCYGLGWCIEPYRGHQMLHHSGGIDGFTSLVSFLPHDNIGIVILTNKLASHLPKVVTYNIVDRLLGLKEIDWSGQIQKDQEKWEEQLNKQHDSNEPSINNIESNPPHPLIEYIGTYKHPGYGTMYVELEKEHLQFRYNSMTLPVTHIQGDLFETLYELPMKLKASFHADSNGNIHSLSLPLNMEVGAKETVFAKMFADR